MLRMAAMRQPFGSRFTISVVHSGRESVPVLYSPSTIATSGVTKRTAAIVIARTPGLRFDVSSIPLTRADTPRRHSPLLVYWSASSVKSAPMAPGSFSSRARV